MTIQRSVAIKLYVVFGCALVFFLYVGSHNPWRSAALAVGAALLCLLLVQYLKADRFQPYWLIVSVNLKALLTDTGLIHTEEEWKEVSASVPSVEQGEEFAKYTFLAISPKIFLLTECGKYVPKVETSEWLFVIQAPWREKEGKKRSGLVYFPPTLSFGDRGRGGFEFGLRVDEEWWVDEGGKNQAHPSVRQLPDGDGKLMLGTIPSGYFPEHVGRLQNDTYGSILRWHDRRWQKKLHALGWTIERDESNVLSRNYITVSQHRLE